MLKASGLFFILGGLLPIHRVLINVVAVCAFVNFILLKRIDTIVYRHRDAVGVTIYIHRTIAVDDDVLNPEAENCCSGFFGFVIDVFDFVGDEQVVVFFFWTSVGVVLF